MFFAQRLGLDDFVNGGLQRFPMSELTCLIGDVRRNSPLDLVTLPGRWQFKHDVKFGYNNQGAANTWQGNQGHGAKIPTNEGQFGGGFIGTATTPMGPDPYITTSGVIPQIYTPVGMQGQG